MVKKILHFEGFVLLLAALYFYQQIHGDWLLFILLLFVPDISMVGYLKDKKLGAILYNLMHNYVSAIIIGAAGLLLNHIVTIQLGLILFSHVALDRGLGYGLKYPTHFKDTHLQKV